ncbi:4-oxalomesaconate tautomerase [Rubellimicrobium aerolatum]|uniref:4-oxalomesaconate tautomerase n=1 Tax=Rubellimicrobium aerolatum TaxID=490979 RepID=A0ABW0SCH6_9RHOB|nr:4-oxalomesaconate tautomerase [Rubellimicrobium aerolatum]MBP1806347.1 4-oxalomesaconate tautomerase [Rubellimicrobium aerolatum]
MSDRPDPVRDGIPCLWMRGGTSKGVYLLAADLPSDPAERDRLLLRLMGSPDPRQIDGIGGADPLTSKVAILSPASRADADVDYLFLQVFVDRPLVTDAQGCGNILAGVGPAAIERGLVAAQDGETPVRIHMRNTGEVALARVRTPGGRVSYEGDAAIDGVPGTAAPVPLMFQGIAGSMCGALLPTGNAVDVVEGVEATLIDNGMPCVVLRAADLGITGREDREALEADATLKARVEAVRLAAGPRMNLGDVTETSVPKMILVAAPQAGGAIATRAFIPHRVHATIGVFAAVSVATACTLPGSPAAGLAKRPTDGRFAIEHPTGAVEVLLTFDEAGQVTGAGTLRTARKLLDGRVFAGTAASARRCGSKRPDAREGPGGP